MWWTTLDRAYDAVHDARDAVEKARLAYSKGGGTQALNAAEKRLANAHFRVREISGNRVRDTR